MNLEGIELRRVRMPLITPFRSAHGTEWDRDILLVRAVSHAAEGWGECVAQAAPTYTSEYVGGAEQVISEHLLPRVFAAEPTTTVDALAAMEEVKGHRMAKAALELALLDCELREAGVSLSSHLGGVRSFVDAGVSLGLEDSVAAIADLAEQRVAEGYRRVKLKIEPGRDIEVVAGVRERLGDDVALQVDANGSYRARDAATLASLDPFHLVLIEQPLPEEDLLGSAQLARLLRTPICLDESITSPAIAALAIAVGACAIVNIKPGRVGGYLAARRVHDVCAASHVPVWCGGMLETGLGRAANAALASLPGFRLPGDLSASDRYFAEDLTEPLTLHEGRLEVPTGPGIGRSPRPEILTARTTSTTWIAAGRS